MDNFFNKSLSGFIITDLRGIIIRCNKKISEWTGIAQSELIGKRLHELMAVGSRIYFETHLSPLLKMQDFFEEIQLDIKNVTGAKMAMLVNAIVCNSENTNNDLLIYYTMVRCKDRITYEQNLKHDVIESEKRLSDEKQNVILREQLIAVLGHDLRNPLSSISMAAELLKDASGEEKANLLHMVKRSSYRMQELISNIMDFARTRLGEGILIKPQEKDLAPILQQVADELQYVFPSRRITTELNIDRKILVDADRVAQLVSNLVANAVTHGDPGQPIMMKALLADNILEISVSNGGVPIPVALQANLFEPFTKEGDRPSKNGLGLGLYISAQIAKAHNGQLTFKSDTDETCFIFSMRC